jgi:hypothetical protein
MKSQSAGQGRAKKYTCKTNERRLRLDAQPIEGLGGFLMDRGSLGQVPLRPAKIDRR